MKHFQWGAKLTKPEQIEIATTVAIDMILQSVKCGEIPSLSKIKNFSHLHEFVDANEYLLGTRYDFTIEEYNTISASVDAWIKF